MDDHRFTQLTPVGFLQTFVLELMNLRAESESRDGEQLIERIAQSASRFFEEAFRAETGEDALDRDRYIDLIIGLKNRIGGHFSVLSADAGCVHVISSRCPFGEGVRHSPELCRMTSSVFGGIAARNFGYAKVELKERIALGHAQCSVLVHLNPEAARTKPGIEYRPDANPPVVGRPAGHLQSRIDERLHALWCQAKPCTMQPEDLERPILIAESRAMKGVLEAIETLAPTPATVLIEGETGVGKELVARAIHAMSDRTHKPFIAINCGAIPEGIVESVLFGHEKGAFTGAIEAHRGYFERADGGTLFLDEVDALTPAVQVRLLRVLQEGELERVGGQRSLSVDVRIIAATNFGLARAVENGSFRRDLFYRINVVTLFIPRLAQRSEDIPHLVDLILKRLSLRYRKAVHGVTPALMRRLIDHDWPGNVRELENTLERAVLFAKGSELDTVEFTPTSPVESPTASLPADHRQVMEEAERTFLDQALHRSRGDIGQLASALQITRRAVYQKLKKHELNPADYRRKPATGVDEYPG